MLIVSYVMKYIIKDKIVIITVFPSQRGKRTKKLLNAKKVIVIENSRILSY